MNRNTCQCGTGVGATSAAAHETLMGASHAHLRLPAILRFRGQRTEAETAAQFLKIESLAFNLDSVLREVVGAAPGSHAIVSEWTEKARSWVTFDAPQTEDVIDAAAKHAALVERLLEAALKRLRTHAGMAGASLPHGNGSATPSPAAQISAQPVDAVKRSRR